MSNMNYDIKQITNFVCENAYNDGLINSVILVDEKNNDINIEYYILEKSFLINPNHITENHHSIDTNNTYIFKLGYTCEPRAFDCPIRFSQTFDIDNSNGKPFYLNKNTKIFEINPGTFKNINEEEPQEIECLPRITKILIPRCKIINNQEILPIFKFKLDYVFSINII